MQIRIDTDDKNFITISDERLDNDAFVDVFICTPDKSVEMTVPMSELMPALIAFDAKRSKRLSEESTNN